MTVLYPNPCYNQMCYKGTALYLCCCNHQCMILYECQYLQMYILGTSVAEQIKDTTDVDKFMLITYANGLDPDQNQHNVSPHKTV